jgi:hypothetical protein
MTNAKETTMSKHMTITVSAAQTTITMTAEQTEIYDNGGDDVRDPMMRALRVEARRLHESHGRTVEIHTADGVVADVAQ